MQLDPQTLLVSVFVTLLVCAVALSSYWNGNRDDRAVALWAAALSVIAAGVALFALRGRLPGLLDIALANALIIGGYCLLLSGVRVFSARAPLPGWAVGAVMLSTLGLFAQLLEGRSGLVVRIAVHAVVSAMLFGLMAWYLQRNAESWAGARRVLARLLGAHALFFMAVVGWAALPGSIDVDTIAALPRYSVLIGLEALVVLVASVVLMMQMLAERHNARLAVDLVHDELTGVLNRRGFMDAVERELGRREQRDVPVQMAVVDIDWFKNINDTLGHRAGDVVLRCVAQTLQGQLRATEPFGRLGGEEFGVLLRAADAPTAARVLERLRQSVQDLRVELPDGRSASVTISIGCAGGTLPAGSPELRLALRTFYDLLFQAADAALYRAKAAGRNRVEQRALHARLPALDLSGD